MTRPFAIAALALICLLAAAVLPTRQPATSAFAATATPTPIGIQFDQIDKTIMGDVSAVAPGSFQPDYKTIVDTAQETKGRPAGPGGMFGNLGNLAGKSGAEISAAMSKAMNAFSQGTLLRHSFAWTKGWERVDEVTAQRAKIYKCDLHQVISLDLAKKTYRIGDDRTEVGSAPPGMTGPGGRPGAMTMRPGTATMAMSVATQVLGPKTVESIDTTGYKSTMSMKMDNATGSCQGGQFGTEQVEYVSAMQEPRRICQLPRMAAPGAAAMVARGGCTPTITQQHTGPAVPARFYMFRLMTMNAQQAQAQAQGQMSGFGMLSERGNVKILMPDDLSLFEVPAGFTKEN